jgi:hypothetical protein
MYRFDTQISGSPLGACIRDDLINRPKPTKQFTLEANIEDFRGRSEGREDSNFGPGTSVVEPNSCGSGLVKFWVRFRVRCWFRIQTIFSTSEKHLYKILPFKCQKQHYFPESWPLTLILLLFSPFSVVSGSKSGPELNPEA